MVFRHVGEPKFPYRDVTRMGCLNRWWYITYGGRNHYGSFLQVLGVRLRVFFGFEPPKSFEPYGEHR